MSPVLPNYTPITAFPALTHDILPVHNTMMVHWSHDNVAPNQGEDRHNADAGTGHDEVADTRNVTQCCLCTG